MASKMIKCSVCGNNNEAMFSNYFSLSFSDIKRCQRCGFVFVAVRKTAEPDYRGREDYFNHLTSAKLKSYLRNCQSRFKMVKKIIKPGMALLEVGCHEGTFLKVARDFGCRVLGLEPNNRMVDYAKYKLNLPVVQGTFEDFKTNEKRFDAIALFNTFDYIKSPEKTIQKISFLLKSNGYLILELPNIDSYLAKKLKENWELITPEHLFWFSPKTIKTFLTNYGFSIEKISVRQFNEWDLGIKQSLTRLGFSRFRSKAGRRSPAAPQRLEVNQDSNPKHSCLKPIRFLLNVLVKIFQRGDYIFIMAKKEKL